MEKIIARKLDFFETEKGIKLIKDTFERKLAERLKLLRVTSPRFLKYGTGLQDDLAGTQEPVSFRVDVIPEKIEITHSLAKWKRYILGRYGFKVGSGIYTDMDAIRKDEGLSDIHSFYVDQWDWELVITKEQRTLDYLQEIVKEIYSALLDAEAIVEKTFPTLKAGLPKKIKFLSTQELEDLYPDLTPKQREDKIAEKFGGVFITGIGHELKSGEPHDIRAADYDDWKLCGDIIVWDRVRKKSLELSSMGIRVDKESLLFQLEKMDQMDKIEYSFHKSIIEEKLPYTIGGGIGQSRICMLLLQKLHIGEVQASVWPVEVERAAVKKGVVLL